MTNDRDEEFLRTKLTDGLHPAEVDLWPAVAEALPNARPAWPWRRIALCLAAPLLIAAGVLAGTAEFTNLRENPRPSFAPEANTTKATFLPMAGCRCTAASTDFCTFLMRTR